MNAIPALYLALIVAALMPTVLAFAAGYWRTRQFKSFDNHLPRLQQAQMTGAGARALGAQANAWEALMTYAAAVLVIQASGLNPHALATAAWVFLVCRVLHAIFYLTDQAALRSLSYFGAIGSCLYLFYQAAVHWGGA